LHGSVPLAQWLIDEAQRHGIRGATLVGGIEGLGHDGRTHAINLFDLSDQPVQVTLVVNAEEARRLFSRLAQEKIEVFYMMAPVEFGVLGSNGSGLPRALAPIDIGALPPGIDQRQGLMERLQRVEDELAIRNLAARFTDAVNERDVVAFRALWAIDATWEIGSPFQKAAQGVDAIAEMFTSLLSAKPLFVQLTHSGIVSFTSETTATSRFTERERGKGPQDFYENLAVYRDELVKQANGWRFKIRFYEYRYLDTTAFAGAMLSPKEMLINERRRRI
jgi:PII-like signaling protein